jgi:hypothetical protein
MLCKFSGMSFMIVSFAAKSRAETREKTGEGTGKEKRTVVGEGTRLKTREEEL